MSSDANSIQFLIPASVTRQGDGVYTVRAGRPSGRMTPGEVAIQIGVSRSTVYRYINEGKIPMEMVTYVGPRKIYVSAAAVSHVIKISERARE